MFFMKTFKFLVFINFLFVCCTVHNISEDIITSQINVTKNSRIHIQKCHEYQAAVYDTISIISLIAGGQRQKIQIDKCGQNVVPLIVGGDLAQPREFPHSALIGFENFDKNSIIWACGGTLISDRYILTAAHCLYSRQLGEPQYVRLGELDLNITTTNDSKPQDYLIEQIISYPEYKYSSKYHDLALIKLYDIVQFNPYIRPACLPYQYNNNNLSYIATGWGQTKWLNHNSTNTILSTTTTTHLQKVILEKFQNIECNEIYKKYYHSKIRLTNGILDNIQICAGSKNQIKDTCQGDSGGPLLIYHPNEYCMNIIEGITSFGIQCGNIGIPGIYTRIYPYIDWIEKIVWDN